ncbi:MAG: hypothetical protein L7U87_00910 [Chlamydiales bacterium]|nr:hypothetical protein [Chlamydiales bacterium]
MPLYTSNFPQHRPYYYSLPPGEGFNPLLHDRQKNSTHTKPASYKTAASYSEIAPVAAELPSLDDIPPPPVRLVRQDSSASECNYPGITVTVTFLNIDSFHSYPEKRSLASLKHLGLLGTSFDEVKTTAMGELGLKILKTAFSGSKEDDGLFHIDLSRQVVYVLP